MTRLTTYALCFLLLTATMGHAAVPNAACRGLGNWSDLFADARDAGTTFAMAHLMLREQYGTGPTYDVLVIVLKHVYVAPSVSKAMLRLIVENVCMQNSAWNK